MPVSVLPSLAVDVTVSLVVLVDKLEVLTVGTYVHLRSCVCAGSPRNHNPPELHEDVGMFLVHENAIYRLLPASSGIPGSLATPLGD